jgi:hypothetical protein
MVTRHFAVMHGFLGGHATRPLNLAWDLASCLRYPAAVQPNIWRASGISRVVLIHSASFLCIRHRGTKSRQLITKSRHGDRDCRLPSRSLGIASVELATPSPDPGMASVNLAMPRCNLGTASGQLRATTGNLAVAESPSLFLRVLRGLRRKLLFAVARSLGPERRRRIDARRPHRRNERGD